MDHSSYDASRWWHQARPKVGLVIVLCGVSLALAFGVAHAAEGEGSIAGRITYVGGVPGDHPIQVCIFAAPEPTCVLAEDGAYVVDNLADDEYTVKALVNVYTDDTDSWDGAPEAWYDPDADGEPDTITIAGGAVTGIDISIGGPWIPLDGPTMVGGEALALAVDADDPDVVYASVKGTSSNGSGRLFKSSDAGVSWTVVYTSPMPIVDLAARGDKVCATGFDGGRYALFCSGDSGAVWTELNPIEPVDVVHMIDLAISSEISSTLLVAGRVMDSDVAHEVSVVYGSTDDGDSWARLLERPNPEGMHGAFFSIAEDPSTPNRFFVGGTEAVPDDSGEIMASIYRITDGGWVTATQVYSSTTRSPAISLAVDPGDGDIILAATPPWFGLAGVLRSDDGGDTWAEALDKAGAFVAVPTAGNAYAVRDDGKVYASADGGASWNDGVWVGNYCYGFAAGTNLYAGGCVEGVLRSTDDGATWSPSNSGITSLVSPRSLAVDPFDPDRMYAAADCGGGWRSEDGGASWEEDIGGCIGAYVFDPRRPGLLYRGEYSSLHGALERSADGGEHWEVVYTATMDYEGDPPSEGIIFAVAPAPSRPTTVYAGGADNPNMGGRHATIVRSTEDGVLGSWTEVFSMTHESWVNAIAVHPTNPLVAYAGGAFDCGDQGCQGFIQRTADGGATWSQVFTDPTEVMTIAIDASDPAVLYAGLSSYWVYRSTDGGETWTDVRRPPWEGGAASGDRVVADPRAPGRVYLAGWGTVLESPDQGDTWIDEPGAFAAAPPQGPVSLTVVHHDGLQTLYFGGEGLWSFTREAPWSESSLFLPVLRAVWP